MPERDLWLVRLSFENCAELEEKKNELARALKIHKIESGDKRASTKAAHAELPKSSRNETRK